MKKLKPILNTFTKDFRGIEMTEKAHYSKCLEYEKACNFAGLAWECICAQAGIVRAYRKNRRKRKLEKQKCADEMSGDFRL